MKKFKSVSEYISQSEAWSGELGKLRDILNDTELEETVKWGAPCYIYKGKNVAAMAAFTNYFGLWFYQGALLKDTHKKLMNAQEGKTKALRQWRMTHANDIKPAIIKRYVKEAISNINQGKEIKPVKAKPIVMPDELRDALGSSPTLNRAFEKLTPGKQREYAQYISEARRESTRLGRINKILPLIRKGQGLNDQYR